MQVVLLMGGKGTRLSEETEIVPKPMVKLGGMPLVWHIMKYYSSYNFNDFIFCLGYKGDVIKDYFCNYHIYKSDIHLNTRYGSKVQCNVPDENWDILLANTGMDVPTGSRLLRIKDYIDEDIFLFTYADGLCDVNLDELIKFHKDHKKLVTLTGVQKIGKFGIIQFRHNKIYSFKEKPMDDDYINGGYFVCNKEVFDHIVEGDLTDTLEKLAKEEQLMVYKHRGDWHCVDSMNDLRAAEEMWKNNKAFWKIWG